MPTFERCDSEVDKLAIRIIPEYETHQPLIAAKAKIDYVFAYGDRDDKGELLNDALKKNGMKALGIPRKISLKDRALGRGDAEIAIDGDWWTEATSEERKALLDHELHHLAVKIDERGIVMDDLGRPKLQLRHHDYEFGFFRVIAARHGNASQERIQAKVMMDQDGQLFWGDVAEVEQDGHEVSHTRFSRIVNDQ